MIGVPINPNSVYISMIPTGCSNSEFDSTYPIHLNDIISQDEFQESIHRINHAFHSFKTYIIISWIIFSLTIGGGTICFIVAGITAASSVTSIFYILIGVGIGLTSFGSIFIGIAYCIIYLQRTARMRQAIANESIKYSSRSPIPCSWRLDSSKTWVGEYAQQNNYQMFYHLAIDIGHSVSTENSNRMNYSNRVAPEPTSFFGQQDNTAPPAYSDQSAGFCSQCSAPRQDFSAKFCSSCGHSFDKY